VSNASIQTSIQAAATGEESPHADPVVEEPVVEEHLVEEPVVEELLVEELLVEEVSIDGMCGVY
jgi:mycofactocin precursor